MINKKSYMCLFIILILLMLGMSVVSAEDADNVVKNTTTTSTPNTISHEKTVETNKIIENSEQTKLETNTLTNKTNTTKKINKIASQTTNTKSEASTVPNGYTVYQIGRASEFTRKGTNIYYNLTDDIVFTTSSDGAAFTVSAGDKLIINGNGHIISYRGSNNVYFSLLRSTNNPLTSYVIYNVVFENFTDSVLSTEGGNGPGNVNITNCIFRNNKNPRTTNENGGGGAIMFSYVATNRGTVYIKDSDFINNTANRGGAIFYNDPMNLYISNCYFANNSALGSSMTDRNGGGAIFAEDGSSVNLISCTFENNTFNRNGVIEQNNIAVYGDTSVKGYNINVNGTYITDITNKTLGIYATTQNDRYGFHGDVRSYNTYTSFEGINTTLNNSVRYTLRAVEGGFDSGLRNFVLHITFNDTRGNVQRFDRTVDDDGYTYIDYSSEIAGNVTFSVDIDDFYADVLRSTGLKNELIYNHSTTKSQFTIFRLNTTTTCDVGTFTTTTHTPKIFTVTVKDANGNPVTSGSVDMIIDGNIVKTVDVEDGIARFNYTFTTRGTPSIIFNYTGTTDVYNSSQTNSNSIRATINNIVPVLNVTAHDVYIDQPANVLITLKYGDNKPASHQRVTVVIGDEGYTEDVYTNSNGEITFTNYTFNNQRNDINVIVRYAGNDTAGLAAANDASDTYMNDKYSSRMTLKYQYSGGVGNITVTLKGVENDEDITSTVKPHITIRGDGDVLLDTDVEVIDGVGVIPLDQPLFNARIEQAQWTGDTKYYGCSATELIASATYPSKVTIETPGSINVGEEFDIRVVLTNEDGTSPLANEIVYLYINGELVLEDETSTNGHLNYAYTPLNNSAINIFAKFEGNSIYEASNNTKNITSDMINSIPTSMTINVPGSVRVNESFTFNVSLTDTKHSINEDGEPETITVLVNNNPVTATYDAIKKVYVASYKPMTNEDIVINASYAGSTVYMPTNASNTQLDSSKINKIATVLSIVANPSSTYVDMPVTITIKLTDSEGNAISGKINYTINGTTVRNADITTEGITQVFTSHTAISNVVASAEYMGSNVYDASSNTTTFNITRIPTITKVNVLNTTTGNVIIDVVVMRNDDVSGIVDEGYIQIDIGNYPTQTEPIVSGTQNTTIKLSANVLPASNLGIHVSFLGTRSYEPSVGVNASNIDEELEYITINYQEAGLDLSVNDSVYVGESVIINGTLKDGFDEPISSQEIQLVIKDSNGNTIQLDNGGKVRTHNNGSFTYTIEEGVYGTYTVSATFSGTETVNSTTVTKSFNVILIPTNTRVTIVNNTVGNVTLNVSVTDARSGVTANVTKGSIKVTYNGNTETFTVNSNNTIIPLTITSTDPVDVSVVYVDDSLVYDTSSDSAFNTINADMDNARVELTVSPVNVLTQTISVNGKLLNGLNQGFSGTVSFTFNDTAYTHESITTGNDGTFSFTIDAVKLGNISLTATFNTIDKVINGASNTTSFNVTKIPTQTNVMVKGIDGDIVTVGVRVQNNSLDYITSGQVELIVDGESIKTVTITDYTYQEYLDNKYLFIPISEAELVAHGLTSANLITANYLGTEDYENSTGTYDVHSIRANATIKVELNKTTAYVNESVDVTITLTDENGHAISGDVELTIKDRTWSRAITVTDGVAKTTILYSNSTIGSYNISARLRPSALYDPAENSTVLNIVRIPTTTLVSIINDTWNKTQIKVEVVNNLTNQILNYGQFEVYINNANQTDNYYPVNGQPVIVDIETLYAGRFDINIKYHENEYYMESTGIDKLTANDTNTKFDTITIKSQKTNLTISTTSPVYVGDVLVINGTLYNRDSNEYLANQDIHITVNGREIGTNRTDNNGKYIYYYTTSLNGTYIAQANFIAITNIEGSTANVTYTVNKIDTKTIAEVLNNTVGNVTVRVQVNDIIHNTIVTSGKLNITINGESYTEDVTGETTILKLDKLNTSTKYNIDIRFIEDDKYLSSRAIDNNTIDDPSGEKPLTNITVENQTATLTVTTDKESYFVGDNIVISGTLKDGLGNNITATVQVTVDNKAPKTVNVENGVYTLPYVADRNGTINVTVKYAGNSTINNLTSNKTFNVNKINTTTVVGLLNNSVGNVTINITVTGDDNKIVTDGDILVTITGVADPIRRSVNQTGTTIILLDDINTDGTYTVSVKYLGNGTYNESTGMKDDGTEFDTIVTSLQDPLLSINVPQNDNYVLGNITITGKLTDAKGNIIPGDQYVTLTFNNIDTTSPILVNSTTGMYTYTRETHFTGDVNVTVNYEGIEGKFNSQHNESSYTIIKIPTETRVTIVNNTYGAVNINVEVIDTVNNKHVSNGWLHVTFNGEPDVKEITSNVTNVILNAPDANRYLINVLFNGTEYYNPSTGKINGTNNELENITVIKQNSTITLDAQDTLYVDELIRITGRVTDGLNNPITDGEEIAITITGPEGTVHRTAYISGGNGEYTFNESINVKGEYTILASFGGTTSINASHATKVVSANKKNTITTMELVNSTIGNITIKVEVTDYMHTPITNGSINVTIGNTNYTKTFDNTTNYIKLDEITSVDNVDIKVEYLGSNVYNPSTATDAKTGDTNITFTPEARNSTITIELSSTDLVVNSTIVISGRLQDELGNDLENEPIIFEVTNGNTTDVVTGYTTGVNGLYSYPRLTNITGPVTIKVIYEGKDDGTISGSTATTTYHIDKLPTKSYITNEIYEPNNITYKVWFTPGDSDKILKQGWFEIKVNGSDDNRAFYYFNQSNTDQKFNITITDEGYAYITLDNEFYDAENFEKTGQVTYIYLTYHGDEIYGESSSSISELSEKGNLTVRIIMDKDTYKVNEKVPIFIELVNENGLRQNARINITIGNTTITNVMSSRDKGYSFNFTNETGRDFTIEVEYPGSGAWNPTSGSKTFTIEKLETQTLVNVVSSTYGNLQIEVTVNDTDSNSIVNTGIIDVIYGGLSHPVDVSTSGTTLIDINVEEPGSYVPITVNYLENPSYKASTGVNSSNTSQEFTHIIVEPQTAIITVNVNHNDTLSEREFYVGDRIVVSGRLTNPLGIVSGKDITITINGTTAHATTNDYGYYEKVFERDELSYKGNGTFTVNVVYEGNASVAPATSQVNYTVYKIPTNTIAAITNNTAGNVWVNVTVNNQVDNTIIKTGYVYFYDSTGSLIALINLEESNGTRLPITTSGEYTVRGEYIGTQKYLNSTAIDNETQETLGPITVVNQTAKITISVSNDSVMLGQSVTINGTVLNGLGSRINGDNLVKITIGDDIYYANLTNGAYRLTNVTTSIGLKEVTATFIGKDSVDPITSETVTFNVTRIPTTTIVDVANTTVGNASIDVKVINSTGGNVTTGQLNVTVNGKQLPLVNINSSVTNIKLENVTSMGEVTVTVEYVRNDVFDNSTGIDAKNIDSDENTTFTGFNTTRQTSVITVVTNATSNLRIGETVNITGTLYDDRNQAIDGTDIVNITIDDESYLVSVRDGNFELINITVSSGNKTVIATYNGDTNINGTTANTSFIVNKIPTTTNVTIVSNVVENFTVDVVVKDYNGNIVTTGYFDVFLRNETTRVPVNSTGTTRINVYTTYARPNVAFTVTYLENEVYLSSKGYRSTGEELTNITIVGQTPIITVSAESPRNVGQTVIINGTLHDGLNRTLADTALNVYVNGTTLPTRTNSNGEYSVEYIPDHEGIFTASVVYTGTGNIYGNTKEVNFTVNRIETDTLVELVDSRVDNVTIKVTVTGRDGNNVTMGKFNVTIGDRNTTYNVTGSETIVKLNINTVDTFNLLVTYLDNNKYINSTGKDENGDEFNTITTSMLDSHITIEPDAEIIRVGRNVTVTGILTDDLGRPIPEAQFKLVFNDGVNTPEETFNTTDANGRYSYTRHTHLTGEVNVTVIYAGNSETINGTNNSMIYTVNKLPTQTRVTVLNYTRTNVTLHIVIEDSVNLNEIISGKFNVTVNGNYVGEYDIEDYLVDGRIIYLVPESYLTDDYDTALICFVENDTYLASNATASGNLIKLPTKINITLTNNNAYIDEAFDITFTLTSNDAPISGYITYRIGEDEEVTVLVPVEGYTITGYSNDTAGLKNITARFTENRTYYASENITYFNITKLPTTTNVSILNDTVGNASIKVVVNDTFNNQIVTTGNLSITLGDETFNVPVDSSEIIIPLNVTKKDTLLTVTYQENSKYQFSRGLDNNTGNVLVGIDVKAQVPSMNITSSGDTLVGYTVTIEGDLKDGLNNSLVDKLITVTVNGTTLTNYTDNDGHYMVYYHADRNGTFTAIATYNGNTTIDGAVRNTSFTVSKINTTTVVSVINNTVGNVTISVNVTGKDGSQVTRGQLNVTVNGTSTLYPVSGEVTPIKLGLNTTEHVDVKVEFVEDNTYLNSTGMTNDSIAEGNPEEFTGITADKENVTLIINVTDDNVDVGRAVIIDIRLTDGMGNPITGYINLTYNGQDEEQVLVNNGHLSHERFTHIAGNVTVRGTFFENATANKAEAEDSYLIQKIDTNTTVSVANSTVGNYTILVHVVDKYLNVITNGTINITVNGVTTNHNITGMYTPITLENVTSTEETYNIRVLYTGNETYKESIGITEESATTDNPIIFGDDVQVDKQNATITIDTPDNVPVHELTIIQGTLHDGMGNVINGTDILEIYINDNLVGHASVDEEGNYVYPRTTYYTGPINVTVRYVGNDNINSVNVTDNYMVTQRPTVTIVNIDNNTVGNVEISIVVKDKLNNETINNGSLTVAFNGEEIPVNITSDVTTVKLNTTGALSYAPLSVKYMGNYTYQESRGVTNTSYTQDPENPEELTDIEVIKQTANMTINNSGDSKVGYIVTIEGYLKDGFNNPIIGRLISVTISNATTLSNYTDNDGHYIVYFKADHNGTYTANATYNGNNMVASQTVNTSFTITKLNTTTSVSIINNTVGNVTIGVNVTDEYNHPVTSGQINVTVNGTSTLYSVSGEVTPIKLGLNTTEHVDVKVEFVEDNTYLNSTGMTNDSIAEGNPEEFTGITADKENVTLIINALEDNVDVGRHITIDIRLTDGMGNPITGYVNLTFNNEDEQEVLITNGHISFDRSTHLAGNVTVRGTFFGNSTANKATSNDTYKINKINTTTIVSVENNTVGNVTIIVEVVDKYGDNVLEGNITVTVNDTSSNHTITGKYTTITLADINSTSGEYHIQVDYMGDDKYEASTGITRESYETGNPEEYKPFDNVDLEKQNAILTLEVVNDYGYVGRNVTIIGNLTDGLGNGITTNITLYFNDVENITVEVINGTFEYNRTTHFVDTVEVKAVYNGTDDINPCNATDNYTINRIPTTTLVDLLNSTSGNVTIDVAVIDNTITEGENNVSTGTLQITIPGKTFQVNVTSSNTTIALNITSVKPTSITVKYLQNDVYEESTGVNKTSYEEDPTNPEEFTEINVEEIVYQLTVNATPQKVYIGQPVTINGTLLDASGNPVKRTKIIIDINTDSETVRTDDNGYYSTTYTPDYNGTYYVNATYLGSRTVSEIIANTTFNVDKIPTTTIVSIENNTAGNITLNVTVKDYEGRTVTKGLVNVTDDEGNVIGTGQINAQNNYIKLDINGNGTFNIHVNYIENDEYKASTGLDSDSYNQHIDDPENAEELTSINVTKQTANLTVNTTLPEVYVGHNNTIMGTLYDGLGNGLNTTVTITVNNTPYDNIQVIDGKYELNNIIINNVGLVNVNVTYAGNENITSINTSTTYNVLIKPLNVEVNVTNNTLGNTTINVTVVDPVDGEKINGTVIITLPNGTNVTTPIENGTVTVPVDIPVPGGDYNITVIPEDTNYNKTIIEDSITIQPRNSTITVLDSNNTAGNVTVDVEIVDPVTGEPITEGFVNVTVDDETVGRVPVGPDGKATIPVDIQTNGTYSLVANYEGTENYTSSSYPLDNVEIVGRSSNITVTVENDTYGNTTINITLVDPTTNETFNGTVNITLPNGTNITANITNGSVEVPIDVPVPGGNITITYPGDDVHNGTNITVPITVNPRNSTITASVSNNTAGNVTVDVEIVDPVTGEPITEGYVNVTVDGETVGRVPVGPDGKATIPVDIQTNGTYSLVANYEGTENYTSSSYPLDNVEIVGRSSNITVTVENDTYGNTTINITLVDPTTNETFNGTVNITLPNGTNITANITNGSVEVPIDVPVPGGNITITYPGDDVHNGTNITVPITVNPRNSTITVLDSNNTAGNVTVKVNVTDPVTGQPITEGYVNITYNGETVGRVPVDSDGTATIVTNITKKGSYTLVANYEGTENYTASYVNMDTLNVVGKESNLTANVSNTTRGETKVNITLVDPVTDTPLNGTVTVILPNGTRVDVNVTNGSVEVPVDLPVGNNTIKVVYPGDDTYNATETNITVTVEPRDINVTVTELNNTKGNTTLNITLEDPSTGEPLNGTVIVTLPNGTEVPVEVTNGSAVVPVDIPVPGGDVNVTFPTDGTYEGYNTTIPVVVNPRDSSMNATVSNNTAGNTTVTVDVFDPVTGEPITEGYVNITVNGELVDRVPVGPDGKATLNADIDTTGNYTIVANYEPTENYTSSSKTLDNVEVLGRTSNITVTVENDTYGNTTINITLVDPTTNETFNGTVNITLPNGTVVPVNVTNGSVEVPVDVPVPGGNITVTYPGDDVHNGTNITIPITVSPRSSSITAEVSNNTAGNTTVTVTVRDPVTGQPITEGYVNLTVDGVTVDRVPVDSEGKATLNANINATGRYTLVANYEGTENYTPSYKSLGNIDVKPKASNVSADITNTTRGETNVNITLEDPTTGEPINGTVIITLPNGTKVDVNVTNGSAIVPVDLPVGNNTIKVVYPGDDKYNKTETEINVTVEPRDINVTVTETNNTLGNTTLDITLEDPATGEPVDGTVIVTLPNGTEIPVRVTNGSTTVPVDIPVPGGNVTVTFPSDGTYEEYNKTIPVVVNPRDSTIDAIVSNNTAGNTTVKVTVHDPVTGEPVTEGTVEIVVNGKPAGKVPVGPDGTATVNTGINSTGNYTITANYDGKPNYKNSNKTLQNIEVNGRNTNVTAKVTNNTAGNTTINVTIKDTTTGKPINGTVIVTLPNGTNITAKAENGSVKVPVDVPVGNTTVTVTYPGDNQHNATSIQVPVNVTPRDTRVTATVTNSTRGNTTIKVDVKDPTTGKGLNGNVTVTLPSGTKTSGKLVNGTVTVPVNMPVGNTTVTVTYPGDKEHKGTTIRVPVNVTPRDTSITARVTNNTAGNTIVTVEVCDPVTGKPVTEGYANITVDGKTVGRAKVDKDGKATIQTSIVDTGKYTLVANYEPSTNYKAANKTIGNVNVNGRDTNMAVTIDNSSVGSTKIKVTLNDSTTGKPVSGTVTVTLPNGTQVNVNVGKSGTVTVPIDLPSGKGSVTARYNGDSSHKTKTVTTSYNIAKVKVKLTVDSVKGTIGEDITLTAHIVDEKGNPVNGGNIVFKLNGRTLRLDGRFDTNTASPYKFKVVNGLVTYTMKADLYLRAGKNITASYSGSYKYESAKGNVAVANIRKRSAQLSVKVLPGKVKQNNDIVITVKLRDVTSKARNTTSIYTNASLLLKINGVTLKDKSGNNILVPVEGTVVNYVYHVPSGTGAVDNDGKIRNYTVEAVYINSGFYPDTRNKTYYNVERSIVNVNFKRVTVKGNVLSVKANLTDYENKLLVGTNKVCLKINGKTYKQNGKVYYVSVRNGNVDLKNIKLAKGTKVKSLTLVTGPRQPYYGARLTTTDILTS